MFTSLKQRILLGIYIFVLVSIPVGAYLASQATNLNSKATQSSLPVTKEPKSASDSAQTLQKLAALWDTGTPRIPTPKPSSQPLASTTTATSFGPTLSLKIQIDGRPASNESTKLFVGIIAGTSLQSPQYLLSFTVDVPASGSFDNLSLAGLTVGSTYTAILKGDAQIATSSAFTMSPAVTNLNGGQALTMLSGDLNQDNVVNSTDLQIAQAASGSTTGSTNWNPTADLNKDGAVNNVDLAIINNNMNQTGATGAWTSPPPKTASSSGSLATDANTPPEGSPTGGQGYWVWVPK